MYLVFLDIDGVFTSSRVHMAHNGSYPMWVRFDPVSVDFMNYIHDTYNVEFVLMSTWKNFIDVNSSMSRHWVESAFANSGFRGKIAEVWKTDPDETWVNNTGLTRGEEVRNYLEDKDVEDYILFDDNRYDFDTTLPKKRLVQTHYEDGLLSKHIRNAKAIMGVWNKK